MRIAQKKKITDLMVTMQNAHKEALLLAKIGQYSTALNVFADCQDGAIRIGEVIEEEEGPENRIINDLEEYCELLYETSLLLQDSGDIRKMYQNLQRMAGCILESIHCDILETYEVVFLPYKASMWDSMESVWTAANEDPQCKAFVIPIPYFDRNPDGTLGIMSYEGGLYPHYVPVTDWREYDLEKRHPDVIYIHNPYDGCNLVTSVHPYFYAERIKKYTDMLVYIPYFVCLRDVDEEFCDTPGVFFSDRVIVESEKIKNTYIRVLQRFEKEHNRIGMFGDLKKKFLVLGSPKYDKVLDTKREDLEVPPEWSKLINDNNGSKKKVIFYNTTVVTLLRNNKKALDKIKNVLEFFRLRSDIVLLWRPHPLNETMMSSMRSDMLKEYQEIIHRYREDAWGIYDDTPDLHRAIALSDAYYGDLSSVVALYRVTGKPIMIQNLNVVVE